MERPILFRTPMVQAILDGRKTQTRRTKELDIINRDPDSWEVGYTGIYWTDNKGRHENAFWVMFINKITDERLSIKCPYGFPGHPGNDDPADVLWVRETWNKNKDTLTGTEIYLYKEKHVRFKRLSATEWKWKPSIHMPKEACRIRLEITNIRVERVQDITEKDARAEGVELQMPSHLYKNYRTGTEPKEGFSHAFSSFETLWRHIHGNESWASNPWLWVIDFKVREIRK